MSDLQFNSSIKLYLLSSFNFLFTTILLKGLHYQKSMRFHVLNYKIDYYNCGFFLKVKVTLFIKSLSLFFSFLAFSFNVHSYAFSLSLRSSLKNPCFIFLFFHVFSLFEFPPILYSVNTYYPTLKGKFLEEFSKTQFASIYVKFWTLDSL